MQSLGGSRLTTTMLYTVKKTHRQALVHRYHRAHGLEGMVRGAGRPHSLFSKTTEIPIIPVITKEHIYIFITRRARYRVQI